MRWSCHEIAREASGPVTAILHADDRACAGAGQPPATEQRSVLFAVRGRQMR